MRSVMDNYPGGFKEGILIRGIPLQVTHPGKIFWVYNGTAVLPNQKGGSNGNDGTFNAPFATVDFAVSQCTANRGDIVYIKPGHSETFSAADGFDIDVAGVAVIGLGSGSNRPKFILDTAATADVNMSAANTTLYNVVFEAGFADIVRAIQVTAANVAVVNVEFVDQATDENWLTPIKATSTTDNNADGLTVVGCKWTSPDAGCLEFIEINATAARVAVINNFVQTAGTASPLILVAAGKLLTGVEIGLNKLQNKNTANELFFSNDGSTNSGIAYDNYVAHRDVTTTHDLGLESSGIDIFNLYSTSTAALQGGVIPAADVNS